jgi:putative phosphoribosyl transferase
MTGGLHMPFLNRADAGLRLSLRLAGYRGQDVVVLGLPRGGVPVAFAVARALKAPLDVIIVRKLGVPFQPELAMGAIGEGGVSVLAPEIMRLAGISDRDLAAVEARERAELERRASRYRSGRPPRSLAGKTAIIVDDGIATGSTARAACRVARAMGAARVVLAVPVAPPGSLTQLQADADEVVCLETPEPFFAIGEFYADFPQTSDDELLALLAQAAAKVDAPPIAGGDGGPLREEDVSFVAGGRTLRGRLAVPERAAGIVLFAHGSGSSRFSPRNRYVASVLTEAGLGTLLFDLLAEDEELARRNVFDIDLLARRLLAATAWLRTRPEAAGARLGYFGASTGAAAALWAAAEPSSDIAAVVSRGGRPDLAGGRLAAVQAPTLLIVGGHDELVLELNRAAQSQLRCQSRLAVVPGATHLFEEPGTLEQAAALARDWLVSHLSRVPAAPGSR